MLLNLYHKTLTAKKLILEEKNRQPKKKTIINYARNVHVLQHTFWNIVEHYFVQLETFEPVVGILIQYLPDGDTFNLRIQCSVLEVL